MLALFALSAHTSTVWAIDANTPVVPVPAERWGTLEPRGIPGDTTYFTFSSSDGEPNCRTPFWFDVTAAGGFVITATGNSVDIYDARTTPDNPTNKQSLCRPVLGTFNKSDTDFFFFKVATPPNDPSWIAVANGSKMGFMVIDNRVIGNARVLYQDQGRTTHGSTFSTDEVVVLKSGSRRLIYVLADKNILVYDLDRISALGSPCLQEDGCVSNVYLGKFADRATAIAGAGKYLFTLWSGVVSVWDTSVNPAIPTLVGTLRPANFSSALAAWQVGSATSVAVTGFQTTETWNISCLPSCGAGRLLATPSSNYVNASVDPASGRGYLYVSSNQTRSPTPQVEYLFDTATWEELTPPHSDGYWGWYYPGNATGFNNTTPFAAVVADGYLYRSAYSFFDVHELVGAGRPPIASFTWSPLEPYAGDPVTFTENSTGAPNAWNWSFLGANINSSSQKNPSSVVFAAPSTQATNKATLVAMNDLGSSDPLARTITVLDPAPAVGTPVANVSTAPVCSVVEFTANASGKPPLAYDWDVVDSGNAALGTAGSSTNVFKWNVDQNQAPGQYRASLVVSGVGSTPEVLSAPVTITALADLSLDSGPTNAAPDFGLVTFSVGDTGATAWTWDFGDGTCPSGFTKTAAGCHTTDPNLGHNPTHQYVTGDTTYLVTVTIENCRDGSIESDVLQVAVGPVQELKPKFTAEGICFAFVGCITNVGTQISFTNETTGFPESYEVDWNGNGSFVAETPSGGKFTHTYTQVNAAGYKPVLRVSRGSQSKTYTHAAIIVESTDPGAQPSVSVSASPASPLVNATVTLTASAKNCTSSPTSWTWAIGSGGSISGSATSASISVKYSSAGTRNVQATAVGGGTCNGKVGSRTVTVRTDSTPPPPPPGGGGTPPTARFTYSPSSPQKGQAVSFDASSSSNATGYQWDFGDGTKASGVKPSHTYDEAGSYVVKMEASRTDSKCDFNLCVGSTQSTVVVTGEIQPPPPPPSSNGCDGVLADDPGTVCLLDGRFQVQVDWTNQHDNDNEGIGKGELYTGSQRTGLFWFFNPDNIELIVKMIDASQVDGKIWFFYGALSDVRYTIRVLDTATGAEKSYSNQAGAICGLGDTGAFLAAVPPSSSGASLPPTSALGSTTSGLSSIWNANHGILPHDDEGGGEVAEGVLPLLDGRFEVTVDFNNQYADDAPGDGTPIVGTNKSGYFWFFRPDNLELVVKMIDARPVTGNFWVFWGGLSDVKYNIHIRDTVTELEWTYSNPAGSICGGADLKAFTDVPL